jgi:AcrR family transcriptional regulator
MTGSDAATEPGDAVRHRPGPRPRLSLEGIAAAGRRIIERDGLDALSMRTVAHELDTAPASLYRHIADRDDLLLAILEEVAAGLPVDVPGDSPRARLTERLVRAHDYMARHVWVLHVLIRGELVAVNAFAFTDACLADFLDAGLAPPAARTAYNACWHLIIGELLDEHPLRPPKQPNQRDHAVTGFDAARFPAIAATRRGRGATASDDAAQTLSTLIGALLPR